MEDIVRSIPHLSFFQWRGDKEGDDEDLKAPYLNGEQCEKLLEFFPQKASKFLSEGEALLWELTSYIFHYYVDPMVPLDDDEKLKKLLEATRKLFTSQYPRQYPGVYWHILWFHLIPLLKKYKSIGKYSNQGK